MPNARCSPCVVPKTPPLPSTFASTVSRASATSSPKTRMRSSSAICSWSVRLIASPNATTSPSGSSEVGEDRVGDAMRGSATTLSVTVAGSGRRAASACLAASATCAVASDLIASTSSAVTSPRATSWPAIRVIGSRLVSSASSSVDRYFAWVSAPECEYGRVTVAWIRAGPTPARTWLMIDAARSRTSK